ncbi:MMPL family transporter [Mycobacterium sp.]|uniref:MMPL family transporter n=1 Tax=Mycobacterium sp. TaxID=1785 RepID=UPI002DAA0525|nr:MMPL family transporter [Mycobacterium sp.]
MLALIARSVIAAPKRIITAALLTMAVAGVLGAPVSTMLSAGGFTDPDAESNRANAVLIDEFEQGFVPLYLLVKAPGPVTDPEPRAVVGGLVTELRNADQVARVSSPWDVADPIAAGLVSRDGKSALVVTYLDGDETAGLAHSAELAKRFVGDRGSGISVSAGGPGAVFAQIAEQSRTDLVLSEAIVLPISFAVLMWVFGGVFAALIPLAVGGFAILGSMAILRIFAEVTEVSVFAQNLAVAMGLALAIDYSLLLVSRYREEVAAGSDPQAAIRRTLQTAGRTVVFSAVTVALCLATMGIFPMYFLRSFAYGGVSVVALAAVAALLVAPAAILVAPGRVGKSGRAGPLEDSRWYAWALAVMRRPKMAAAGVVLPLIVVGLPFLDVKFGFPDDRILPASAAARQVGDQIRTEFAQDIGAAIPIVVKHDNHVDDTELGSYAAGLSAVPGVVAVSAPRGTYVHGAVMAPATGQAATRDGTTFFTVNTAAEPYTAESEKLLDRLHSVAAPPDTTVLFSGAEQSNRDGVDSIVSRLPMLLTLIAAVMFVLLFLLSGSIVIPLKALLLNALSLTATFGAMVWIFQEGHLGGLGTTVMGTLVATMPVLMFCITFGLSMDYEVFLIARIREFWLDSDRSHAANTRAVALGLAGTGRVVTAGALVMAITFAGLIASQVSFLRLFGFGLTVAVLVDATIIRSILLPALMVLLGRWNWWAPPPLARWHDRLTRRDVGALAVVQRG